MLLLVFLSVLPDYDTIQPAEDSAGPMSEDVIQIQNKKKESTAHPAPCDTLEFNGYSGTVQDGLVPKTPPPTQEAHRQHYVYG